MKQGLQRVLQVVLTLVTLAAFVGSCSSDKSSDSNVDNPTTEQFQLVADLSTEMLLPMSTLFLGTVMQRVFGFDESGYWLGKSVATDGDSVFIFYNPLSGWWSGYWAIIGEVAPDTTISLVVRDSVQFRSLTGQFQREPDSTTDRFKSITRLNLDVTVPNQSGTSMTMYANFTVSDLQSGVADVDGNWSLGFDVAIDTLGKTITGYATMAMTIDHLAVPIPESDDDLSCPVSGVVVYSLTENISSQFIGPKVTNTTWSIRLTVVDAETYLVKITGGNIEFDEFEIASPCAGAFGTKVWLPNELRYLSTAVAR